MKLYFVLFACLFFVMSGCGNSSSTDRTVEEEGTRVNIMEQESTHHVIKGIVVEINSNMVIATNLTKDQIQNKTAEEIISYDTDMYQFSLSEISTEAKIGDIVNVTTTGKYKLSRIAKVEVTNIEVVITSI
ncbi:DUF3221 domain-containing protein [Paenibacillus gallinarum]|uniref:DUF3221 domain-containing protein n=1 Tax=Paenibacillus gallinarum TaxID=2762232 RepID=A0ABR8T1Z7_9BACL|nr:DUF3221 domain-containing protein [Paenibacillus gallinarum]MBD7969329.1 DUF3221 domain-containing protein [Paenibacillus gallinarum]